MVISTKTGVTFDYDVDPDQPPLVLDSTPKSIRTSLEGSLERLGTDHVDLYLQARVDPNVEPETVAETMGKGRLSGAFGHRAAPYPSFAARARSRARISFRNWPV